MLSDIKDYNSLIKYINSFDSENIYKYIYTINFYQKNSIHNIYILCLYIFQRMENQKNINNKFVYFISSLKNNINKLDNYQKTKENIPYWFDKEIKINCASDSEIKEIEDLLKNI